MSEVLRAGALAYIDCFTGLIACRVVRVFEGRLYEGLMVEVVVTATDRFPTAYPRGSTEMCLPTGLVTRKVTRRRGRLFVRNFDSIELTEEVTV